MGLSIALKSNSQGISITLGKSSEVGNSNLGSSRSFGLNEIGCTSNSGMCTSPTSDAGGASRPVSACCTSSFCSTPSSGSASDGYSLYTLCPVPNSRRLETLARFAGMRPSVPCLLNMVSGLGDALNSAGDVSREESGLLSLNCFGTGEMKLILWFTVGAHIPLNMGSWGCRGVGYRAGE